MLCDRQSGFFDRMLKGLTIDGKVVEQAQKIVSSQNTTRTEFLKIAFDKFKGMVEIIL